MPAPAPVPTRPEMVALPVLLLPPWALLCVSVQLVTVTELAVLSMAPPKA
jgi:hypothetical protein